MQQLRTALVRIGSSIGHEVESFNSPLEESMYVVSSAPPMVPHINLTTMQSPVLPTYKMSRKLHTVRQAWLEYESGLDGRTSVKSIELQFGTAWRQDKSEAKFYQRRVPLYRAIDLLLSESSFNSHDLAVDFVENLKGSRSLRSLCDDLKKILRTYHSGIESPFVEHVRSSWNTSTK